MEWCTYMFSTCTCIHVHVHVCTKLTCTYTYPGRRNRISLWCSPWRSYMFTTLFTLKCIKCKRKFNLRTWKYMSIWHQLCTCTLYIRSRKANKITWTNKTHYTLTRKTRAVPKVGASHVKGRNCLETYQFCHWTFLDVSLHVQRS